MKALIDTNIWLRLFVKDNPEQFTKVYSFIEQVEEGKIIPYISNITFLELTYVLKNIYQLADPEILEILEAILKVRNITVIEKTNTRRALELHQRFNVKFSDCLIASQLSQDL